MLCYKPLHFFFAAQLATAACTSAATLTREPDATIQLNFSDNRRLNLRKQSVREIRALTDQMFLETVRVFTGNVSDSLTAGLWIGRVGTDPPKPIRVPRFADVVLRDAFRAVPKQLLDSIIWRDSLGIFASPEVGVVLDAHRLIQILWTADSSFLASGQVEYAQILARPPRDYALLAVVAHELSHLAFHSAELENKHPAAIVDCAADVLGALLTRVVSMRISSSYQTDLNLARVANAIANEVVTGHWVAHEVSGVRAVSGHGDGEQRRACVSKGFDLYGVLEQFYPVADQVILTTPRDSLYNATASGRVSLLATAIEEARGILSVAAPLGSAPPTSASRFLNSLRPSAADQVIIELFKRLASRLDTTASLTDITGNLVNTGVLLFPGQYVSELLIPVSAPWKCAVVPPADGREPSVGCYTFAERFSSSTGERQVAETIVAFASSKGFSIVPIAPATARDGGVSLKQWLIERARDSRRVLLSLYTERATLAPFPGDREVRWFSFAPVSAAKP